jgi:hypothetical protein
MKSTLSRATEGHRDGSGHLKVNRMVLESVKQLRHRAADQASELIGVLRETTRRSPELVSLGPSSAVAHAPLISLAPNCPKIGMKRLTDTLTVCLSSILCGVSPTLQASMSPGCETATPALGEFSCSTTTV